MWLNLKRQAQKEEHDDTLRQAAQMFAGCCRWSGKFGEKVNTVVHVISISIPVKSSTNYLQAEVADGKNKFIVEFTGRKTLAGIKPGATLHLQGRINEKGIMRAPAYDLLAPTTN